MGLPSLISTFPSCEPGLLAIWIPYEGNAVPDSAFPAETFAQGARVLGTFGGAPERCVDGGGEFLFTVHVQISEHWRFDAETDLHLGIAYRGASLLVGYDS